MGRGSVAGLAAVLGPALVIGISWSAANAVTGVSRGPEPAGSGRAVAACRTPSAWAVGVTNLHAPNQKPALIAWKRHGLEAGARARRRGLRRLGRRGGDLGG